jgi:hypothetical protein
MHQLYRTGSERKGTRANPPCAAHERHAATRPTAVEFTGGPLRLVKHESPRVSNGTKTALHGAAQQAIRIPCYCVT